MRITEFTLGTKHYTQKQLCLKALELLQGLPIESIHTSYNSTGRGQTSLWMTFRSVSACFKITFLDLPEMLDFMAKLEYSDTPQHSTTHNALHQKAEEIYKNLKILVDTSTA